MNNVTYNTPVPAERPIEIGSLVLICGGTYIVAQHTDDIETEVVCGISLINIATGGHWTNAITTEDPDWRDVVRNIIRRNDGVVLNPGTQLTLTVG